MAALRTRAPSSSLAPGGTTQSPAPVVARHWIGWSIRRCSSQVESLIFLQVTLLAGANQLRLFLSGNGFQFRGTIPPRGAIQSEAMPVTGDGAKPHSPALTCKSLHLNRFGSHIFQ